MCDILPQPQLGTHVDDRAAFVTATNAPALHPRSEVFGPWARVEMLLDFLGEFRFQWIIGKEWLWTTGYWTIYAS